jgi:(p)ppGpp synthase/HD superfamily hydrolase
LEQITRNALDVKFADRIHNLTTEWDPNNLEKVKRKLEETKKYFLNIAKEVNQVAYDKIQSLVLVLEIRLHNAG